MAVTTEEMVRQFTDSILSAHGGHRLPSCYQCGKCTAGCPVARVTDAFSPKKFIRLAQLGLENMALDKKSPIWLCATCYNCTEVCPQDVEPTEIFIALKTFAIRRGILPMGRKMGFGTLAKKGRMFDVGDKQQQERAALGLDPCPEVDVDQTLAILELRGILPLLTGRKPK
ncbi:MAG: 4Fe-4S dicluster domain-containing protein [Deltaproteobacteria bacterium]